MCGPCVAFVPGVTVGKVALRISITYARPCASTIVCGPRQVPRRRQAMRRIYYIRMAVSGKTKTCFFFFKADEKFRESGKVMINVLKEIGNFFREKRKK